MGGTTALGLLAIKNLHIPFMHLLSMSVDAMHLLNMRDLYGNTPMHCWALRGEAASGILSQLEELGGDFSCVNLARETPRCVAGSGGVMLKLVLEWFFSLGRIRSWGFQEIRLRPTSVISVPKPALYYSARPQSLQW